MAQQEHPGPGGDWTQLPEECRLLIVRCMDSATRAAWRPVCRVACQDIHAATRTLAQRMQDARYVSRALQSMTSSHDEFFCALISRLPMLLSIQCHHLDKLTSLQGIPSRLHCVDLSGCNSLTSLAPLQQCTALERLRLDFNIRSTQQWDGLAATLPPVMSAVSSHLQHLKLVVSYHGRSHSADETAVRALQPLTRLKHLALGMQHCANRHAHCQLLAGTIACMPGLQELDLTDNFFGASSSLLPLASVIRQLGQLRALNLFDSYQDLDDVRPILQAIASLPATLSSLNIGTTDSTDADVQLLADAIQAQSATLSCLKLPGISLQPDGIANLAPALSRCSGLTDLDLNGCCIVPHDDSGDGDWESYVPFYNRLLYYLGEAVSGSAASLTALDVSNNNLCLEGTAALAMRLYHAAPTLTSFSISNNFLGYRGAAVIKHALARMTALTHLGFSNNGIGHDLGLRHPEHFVDEGDEEGDPDGEEEESDAKPGVRLAATLAFSLRSMCSLATLHIQSNKLGAAGAQLLAPALSAIAPSLTCLDISANELGNDGAAALASALRCLTALRRLECKGNSVGPAGAAAVASALLAMVGLQRLDLAANRLGFEGLRSLAQGLQALPRQQWWVITGHTIHNGVFEDARDGESVAAIVSSVTNLQAWELQPAACYHKPSAEAARIKVSGLEVDLSAFLI